MSVVLVLLTLLGLSGMGVHFYLQSIDITPRPIYDLAQNQIEYNKPIQAIDPVTGMLTVQGWAKFPNLISYQPALSKVS